MMVDVTHGEKSFLLDLLYIKKDLSVEYLLSLFC